MFAELLGYGMSADASAVAQPTETGEGAERCMKLALADAGIEPGAVDYLNAHATSTPQGDPSEARAIRAVFGSHVSRVAVSATKSMTCHLLAGSGAIESLVCIVAIRDGVVPPTINYTTPDPECDLDYVPNEARSVAVDKAMTNSFGFGGHNVSLIFAAPE